MDRLKRKLNASTLIETLVAMTLIVLAISLAFISIANIKRSFKNEIRSYAYLVSSKYLNETDSVTLNNQIIRYPSFDVSINQDQYQNNPALYEIKILALTQDSIVLCELKKVKRVAINLKEYGNIEK